MGANQLLWVLLIMFWLMTALPVLQLGSGA